MKEQDNYRYIGNTTETEIIYPAFHEPCSYEDCGDSPDDVAGFLVICFIIFLILYAIGGMIWSLL